MSSTKSDRYSSTGPPPWPLPVALGASSPSISLSFLTDELKARVWDYMKSTYPEEAQKIQLATKDNGIKSLFKIFGSEISISVHPRFLSNDLVDEIKTQCPDAFREF